MQLFNPSFDGLECLVHVVLLLALPSAGLHSSSWPLAGDGGADAKTCQDMLQLTFEVLVTGEMIFGVLVCRLDTRRYDCKMSVTGECCATKLL
mmetsp:Transcript_4220/g.6963  ORF Transcript_4220/g.6963 Transcript_4220/m.6963 type:complete len:93 (-) Transcript_4220:124-402(-)